MSGSKFVLQSRSVLMSLGNIGGWPALAPEAVTDYKEAVFALVSMTTDSQLRKKDIEPLHHPQHRKKK